MFENEIKFINDFTLNKIKDLGSSFTMVQFLSTEIHPSIKKYVESEINYIIHQDRKKLIENSLFDYSGSKISNYFNLIADEIKKSKKISFEDIKNITLQAVSFNANFVVRPKWALSKLIFGNNKSVSINDVEMMLSYTYYYEYLGNVFLAYLNKKKIMNISATEFELIMNKIDRELFTLHQSKLVDNALYAMADFYNIGGLNKSSVPIEAIEMFLKEKNLTELLFKLKKGFPVPSRKKTDIDEIRKVFYSEFPLETPIFEEEKVEANEEGEPEEKAKPQEEIKIENHFENPLKEVLPSMDEKPEEIFEEEENQTISSDNIEATEKFLEDKVANETKEQNPVFEEVTEEIIEEDIKNKVAEQPAESDEEIEEDIISKIKEGKIDKDKQETDQVFEEIIEVTDDEKLLDQFIEETDHENEDEIIIIDDKEEENVLEFFEQEAEITIEDKEEKPVNDLSHMTQANTTEEITEELYEEESEDLIEEQTDLKSVPDDTQQEEIVVEEKIEFEREDKDSLQEQSLQEGLGETADTNKIINKENFEDIFSFLSSKEIDKIIKNLFNSDSEDFANNVEKLSACNSFEEANEILENIFKYARIKPHSKEASALTRAVTKYFEQGN